MVTPFNDLYLEIVHDTLECPVIIQLLKGEQDSKCGTRAERISTTLTDTDAKFPEFLDHPCKCKEPQQWSHLLESLTRVTKLTTSELIQKAQTRWRTPEYQNLYFKVPSGALLATLLASLAVSPAEN